MKSRMCLLLFAICTVSIVISLLMVLLIKSASATPQISSGRQIEALRSKSPLKSNRDSSLLCPFVYQASNLVSSTGNSSSPLSATPVEQVIIQGPPYGYVGDQIAFTTDVGPHDASPPVRYIWSPQPASGQGRDTATYVWTTPGQKTITVTAYNKTGSAVDTYSLQIIGPTIPISDTKIHGPSTGILGWSDTLSATVTPLSATTPIVYTWDPDPVDGQYTPNVTYTWKSVGEIPIVVTATNAGGSRSTTHQVIVKSIPIVTVTVDGPITTSVDLPTSFTAIYSPEIVSLPISYTWIPTPTSGQNSSQATYQWHTIGITTVTAIVSNPNNDVGSNRDISITTGSLYNIAVPLLLKRWPPLPSTPTIFPIINPSGVSTYTVAWGSGDSADSYTLEQDTDIRFSDPLSVSVESNYYTYAGNDPSRYFYRAKAHNNYGDSNWSNTVSTDVLWESEPNTWIYDANGPLLSNTSYFGYPDDQWDCFYFQPNTWGAISVDLDNDLGNGVQLFLYHESYDGCVGWDTQPDRQGRYSIVYSGEPGQYFPCVFTESGFRTDVAYTLTVIYPSTPSLVMDWWQAEKQRESSTPR